MERINAHVASPQTPPEILHADLAPLALELACWGAADATSLAWLDPPPAAPLAQARDLLLKLEAIDAGARVRPHGRTLQKLGMHPRLAHMLIKAQKLGAARLACDLAAILSERDILRAGVGARDADLRLRVAVLRGDSREVPAGVTVDARAKAQAQRTSGQWQRDLRHARDTADPHEATGILLAWAYPDRIARARGDGARYLLANGRGARFGEPQSVVQIKEFIVAAELDGADREARIFLAAPIGLEDLEKHFAALVTDSAQIHWDERAGAVSAKRERRLGALLLGIL